jgi:sugar fermentation stimulation protein A|uniref:Sugar fermentation stimulation protein C-terminal domain-containing protein n=1 Tax=viral metagenome TaxID=1070528 RepID=A0A6C0CAV9_9ZZZZ
MLYKLNDLILVKIKSRPSKVCKTPYVADIELEDGTIVQAHCASLGCCGLCEKDCYVYASPMKSNCAQSKSKVCSYKIYLARFYEEKVISDLVITNNQLIGIDPKLAETLVENALTQNYLKTLTHIRTYKREVCLLNSRFDFAGIDEHGKYFVLEVKNVPLADYADVSSTERKKMIKNGDFANLDINKKISYFPDGYRKKKGEVVSERALKHINELAEISHSKIIRPIICFVIQRTDVSSFQASLLDPIYKAAFNDAISQGVEVIVLVVSWNAQGEASFVTCELPVNY